MRVNSCLRWRRERERPHRRWGIEVNDLKTGRELSVIPEKFYLGSFIFIEVTVNGTILPSLFLMR